MKQFLGLVLALVLLTACASAAVLTDAPGSPTQDRAVALSAAWHNEEKTAYDLRELPADQLTVNKIADVYDFVFEKGNRPVRWYPEETQQAIQRMISADPDSLYMTEFMRLHAAQIDPPADLDAVMTLKIDYQPGQLIVVVLGDTSDPEHIVWTPVESRVTQTGRVEFEVPASLMRQLQNEDILFNLLTVRNAVHKTKTIEYYKIPDMLPSKQSGDLIRIIETIVLDETIPHDFELQIVPETDIIRQELELLSRHIIEENQPALTWLSTDDQNKVRYMLGDGVGDMVISDYVPLISLDYLPTEGDAVASFIFLTPYREGQQIVTALGIPKDGATDGQQSLLDWTVQPAVVRKGGSVDITFNQLALIDMDTDTGLLLMFSEPVPEE